MPSKSTRILGIDPGFGRMGWAVIEVAGKKTNRLDSGCISTPKSSTEAARLQQLFSDLAVIIKKWSPSSVALERLFFQHNASTAVGVGQARGVVLLLCAQNKMPVHEFTPSDNKLATTGYGRADKRQMTRMVTMLLGLRRAPKFDDEIDALAIALCGSTRRLSHAV